MPRILALFCAVLALAIGSVSVGAQGTEVEVGGVVIATPAPPGFHEAGSSSQETQRIAEALTPPENRLLAVFLSEEDLGRVMTGELPVFESYMLLQVLRNIESLSFTGQDYRQLADVIRQQQDTLLDQVIDRADRQVAEGAKQLSEAYQTSLEMSVGEARPLGVFLDQPRAIGFATLVKYDAAAEGQEFDHVVAGSTSFVLAKDKLLYAYIYRTFESQEDLDWVRAKTLEWVGALTAGNE